MALRSVKYLVVDNVVDDVPDGAPEIDVELASPADLASALLSTTHLPPSAEVFLQTARSDGSLRWQPLSAVSELPEGSVLVAKVVRPQRGAPAGAPRPAAGAAHPRPPQQQQPYYQQQQQQPPKRHGLVGGLLRKIVGGGGGGGAGGAGRPVAMGMGGAGMGGAAGGFGQHAFVPGGVNDAEDAAFAQQVQEQLALQELEDAAMRRDDDGDFDRDRPLEYKQEGEGGLQGPEFFDDGAAGQAQQEQADDEDSRVAYALNAFEQEEEQGGGGYAADDNNNDDGGNDGDDGGGGGGFDNDDGGGGFEDDGGFGGDDE